MSSEEIVAEKIDPFSALIEENSLSEQEKALRESFVAEYLKDRNAVNACLRCGFQPSYAMHWAREMLQDNYVVRLITEFQQSEKIDDSKQLENDKRLVLNGLREVATTSTSGSTRVAALRTLAELRDMKARDAGEDLVEGLSQVLREFSTKAPA